MQFYKVLVGDSRFHGSESLTYHYGTTLTRGQIVLVPLRSAVVAGIIEKTGLPKPGFKTKPIAAVLPNLAMPETSLALLAWMAGYYPAPLFSLVQLFISSKLGEATEKMQVEIDNSLQELQRNKSITDHLSLNTAQKAAVKTMVNNVDKTTYILHGETGSGKTRVYTHLVGEALEKGLSSIVLTPEISLTPQLANQFTELFGDAVLMAHSGMTDRERKKVWLELLESNRLKIPRIIIGARSALFMPAAKIGYIILDEAHETAYKQEQLPHYQTTRVAAKLAQLHKAKLILGTATPSVVDYYTGLERGVPILTLPAIANPNEHPVVKPEVIDLKDTALFSTHRYVSTPLLEAVRGAMQRGEQALIFLNRRGTARLVMCEQCGWQALCPECDLPLTYHGDSHTMLCHTCGFRQATPSACPSCGFTSIVFKSLGTKAIEAFFAKHFPHKKVARFDLDNNKAERLEQQFENVASGNVDIIVGTQILAKGLDLPYLSVVGVILADTSLYIPDYTADERTWQLLYQVIGRVGRGHRAGHVVIQTFHPENAAIQAAISKDWQTFYDSQLKERQKFVFPPFAYLLKLSCSRKSPAAAEKAAKNLKTELESLKLPIIIEGPAPSFHEKQLGKYQWQLVIKAKRRPVLTEIINHIPAQWTYDLDPNNLL